MRRAGWLSRPAAPLESPAYPTSDGWPWYGDDRLGLARTLGKLTVSLAIAPPFVPEAAHSADGTHSIQSPES